jgi:hypothetical protein
MGAVIVTDHMDIQALGHPLVDRDHELLELRGTVLAMQLTDHSAVGNVESSE